MRISAYTNVQQLYNNNSTAKVGSEKKRGFSDQLQISNLGKDIQVAKQALLGAPDVREDVTASIKASLDAGTYHVDSNSFAERLIEKYNGAII